MKYVYLENGSGASNPIDCKLVSFLSTKLNLPLIVGGGIKTKSCNEYKDAGAKICCIRLYIRKRTKFLIYIFYCYLIMKNIVSVYFIYKIRFKIVK